MQRIRLCPTNSICSVRFPAFGTRMNYSFFECMLTDIQYRKMYKQQEKIVVRREDSRYVV